jgi:hypothetical protein
MVTAAPLLHADDITLAFDETPALRGASVSDRGDRALVEPTEL